MNKELTAQELYDYIKVNGITEAIRTQDFIGIPKDAVLNYGIKGNYISSYKYHYDYEWASGWEHSYKGKFIIVNEKENSTPQIKESEIEVLETIPTKIKYKNRVYVLERGE